MIYTTITAVCIIILLVMNLAAVARLKRAEADADAYRTALLLAEARYTRQTLETIRLRGQVNTRDPKTGRYAKKVLK